MIDIDFLINAGNPKFVARNIADNFKKMRLHQNITQEELSVCSGVALSSLKRFEQKAEISLNSLLMLAMVLDALEEFQQLFAKNKPATLDDVISEKKVKHRIRARKK